jgi:hypothetical protein
MTVPFTWKPEKNEWLKENRGISFEEIEDSLHAGGLRDWYSYTGTKILHEGQIILVIEIDAEAWNVPVTVTNTVILMRTAY